MAEPISLVAACKDFFQTREPHNRKVEIPEFRALTRKDKEELREMLIAEGYNVIPLPEEVTSE
jgi:hypothetical protein